jgi:rod shape-determining protein MreC
MNKAVRRRRAVLAALVALSIFLLTAYFGEAPGGGLHSVQRGAMEVLAPIQEGANRALKPVRDLFGWFGDTLDARSERDRLRAEADRLRGELARAEVERRELLQLEGLQEQNTAGGMDDFSPVLARVIARSPSSWSQTVQINKGSSDGVQVGQPVMNGAGLVGKVEAVSDGNAQVMLLTDQDFGVSVETARGGEPGTVGPMVGAPGDLRLDYVPNPREVERGSLIVTAGTTQSTRAADLPSLYPRGIPVGTVQRIETGDGELDRVIHVKPAADLDALDLVQVLTAPADGERAQVP